MTSVSIALVSRNRIHELNRCLASIMTQTRKPDEIIIVDNASDSPLCEDALKLDCQHRLLRFESELGVSEARNICFNEASSDIILFMDDDAFFQEKDTQALDRIVNFADENEVDVLSLDVYNYKYGRQAKRGFYKKNNSRLFFAGAGFVLRKKAFANNPFPEEIIYGHEDLYLSLSCLQKGMLIFFFDGITIMHEMSPKRDYDFVQVKNSSMINKYAVKVNCLSSFFKPFLFLAFCSRVKRFYNYHPGSAKDTIRQGIFFSKKLRKNRMNLIQTCRLLYCFGVDFLYEISNTGRKNDDEAFIVNYNDERQQYDYS